MFNKDFYPTPLPVLESMGIDCAGKVVLEPSAGSGNIIDFLKLNGAKIILACEINEKLAAIVKSKATFLKHDFLNVRPEEVSHINMIVMNPPFSKGSQHLLYAWEIAPDGCEIISLLNYETLGNDYSRERRELKRIIEDYGQSTNLSTVFSDSERPTGVEIGLVRLFKPASGSNEFEGFFMDEEEEAQGTGIMQYNSIRDVVNRYVSSVKKFEEIMYLSGQMSALNEPFGLGGVVCEIGYKETVTDKDTYKKELQKKAWQYLFKLMNMDKYVTSGVMKDINKFVENQSKVPFTMKNIYKMFEIIVGTREQTFSRSLVEAVDKFTQHTHENRFNVEGWKTNAGHLLNQKFIINSVFETGWGGCGNLTVRHSMYSNADKLKDLVKVLCSIEGENYEELPSIENHVSNLKLQPNVWYDWDFIRVYGDGENQKIESRPGFFEFKGFKKGTMHLKFKNRDTWARLNQRYAKIKGQVLPEKI